MIRIVGLCGSLRVVSKNQRALQIARTLAPPDTEISLWDGLGRLPFFSPDLDQPGCTLPKEVTALYAEVELADGLLIACPEYAHGIPGAFKNALDWLVGSVVFPGKPVALLNVAPHAHHAQAALREVLTTMSADIVEDACCTIGFPTPDRPEVAAGFEAALRSSVSDFVRHLRARRDSDASA